ncbi:glycoside hydrolase family 97 protein [Chitinophaga polysaccharea]|uniref:glycoside hydrolase family 97 protein n=1 Tax=Chitinophaga polysaccharea TaxID=1293035 RepID=UPI001455B06B|nr:glycoside hydrolase family 97 protein [Chitinophaga polysaccharea]NLR56853.1 glycoside hydrolase family 97 protein [Chitinophaga polysaccharea]
MNTRFSFIIFLGLLFFGINIHAQTTSVFENLVSPDGKLKVTFLEDKKGAVYYSFIADGRMLLQSSPLGVNNTTYQHLRSKQQRQVSKVWKPLWGKRSIVPDAYREMVLQFDAYTIRARLYNDGLAFRYEGVKVDSELTAFNFAGNYQAWYYNGEHHNIGPEYLKDAAAIRYPVMTVKVSDKQYLAIHEAFLESGEPLLLKHISGTTVFNVASKGSKAWRVVMYGRSPGDLVDSHLLELLNPAPEKDADFSWIKPGLAVWDWRINGAVFNGFKYEMSLPSWKRMVDFASKNNISYLVLDADWYGPEFNKASDPVKGGKVQSVKELIQYAKERAVGVWLYLNDVGGNHYPLEETIRQYGEWGAAGIKYGFMQGSLAEKNPKTQRITQLCAQNKLLVDFHDNPVHPYGQMRTYPNAVTREFCQAQLDGHQVFQPKTFVTSVFVNMLSGPLDMNNGIMDMEQKGRVDNAMPVPSTIVAEAARTLITFSGITILPDIPEYYEMHPELLKFISSEAMPWQESKTLSGEIGEYIVMARKSSQGKWLIAAATNEKERELIIPLTVLEKGNYKATIIQDAEDASYLGNKEHYNVLTQTVNNKNQVKVRLAPGGGACLLLEKVDR